MNDCLMSVTSTWRLSRLKLLRYVNLGSVDLSLVPNWVSIINSLPLLEVLRMDFCRLSPKLPSSFSYVNSSNTLCVISLSMNDLEGTSIFRWLHNLSRIESSLEYLDLSSNKLSEGIPSFFWNIISLSHLDLSVTGLRGRIPNDIGKMHRLSFLSLDENVLSGRIPSEIWGLENLSYLSIPGNQLEGPISNTISNLKQLTVLDLSRNKLYFSKHALKSLGELCMLQTLVLNDINLTYDFSQVVESLSSCAGKSLVSLGLSNNQIYGSIPNTISSFTSLEVLHVYDNQLNGTVSDGIGKLSKLEDLDLSDNYLNGVVSHNHLSNLSRLSLWDFNYNQELVLNLSTSWTPPFQLRILGLRSCKIGPNFPKWVVTQKNITDLDISNAGIHDTIPKSFWSSSTSSLQSLNMSNNMIYGVLPDLSITFQPSVSIDMSSNNLSGSIPSFLGSNVSDLNLKNNKLSRGLYRFLCPKTEMDLMFLDLSNNLFSDTLPDCWSNIPSLTILKLQNNNISGNLSPSIAVMYSLQSLHLRNNSLHGEIPMSWMNSMSLSVLDLAYNSLTGYIPPMFGQAFQNLNVLSLRSNKFSMGIPSSVCQLPCLQILDLSDNRFSGTLPNCLYNLSAMADTSNFTQACASLYDRSLNWFSDDIALFMWKRKERNFPDTLGLLKGIDVSNNKLHGRIPDGISNLTGLVFLNLSQNNLGGAIPSGIGQLTSLEFLDLSQNRLSGEIPTSLASIDYLEILDLSKNNLSGKIPLGTQLQGFDASAYMGNPGLCGAPLRKCPGDEATSALQNVDNVAPQNEHENGDIFLGLCISVALGLITGFWGVCGTLVLKRSWRLALFRFYDDVSARVHAIVVVNIPSSFRRFLS
ncbi:hypothetical protein RND81_14G104800 [Saponaria officinalis]